MEVCLNEQISLQSDSLFAAIRQLHDFQLQVNSTLQTIRDLKSATFSPLMLRVSMKSVEATHTIPPLLVPVYVRRINNLKKVQRLVDLSPPLLRRRPSRSRTSAAHWTRHAST